jgi:apolipoprotein N-acyltransferase
MLLAGVDTLVAVFSPHGTFGSYAYTQMDALPVIQAASLAGTAGIVFLAGLFVSTVAVGLYRRTSIERPLLAYGLPLLVLAAGLSFGA